MLSFILYSAVFCVLIYFYLKYKHNYWSRKGIVQFKPEFLFGDVRENVQKKCRISEIIRKFYYELKKKNIPYGGIYLFYKPILIPTNLDLIKQIMSKDYEYFSSHGLFHHENDWIHNNLFNLEGEKWKTIRSKLTPTFTSGKIKGMYDILYTLGQRLEKKVGEYAKTGEPVEIKEHAACFGTDVVATCFFGLDSDCLNEPESEFRKYGRLIFAPRPIRFILEMLINWNILGALGYTFVSKSANSFFEKVVKDTVGYRRNKKISRNDYLDLLMQLQDQHQIDEKELIANTMVMYAAGFETSSTTTTFLLYELAKNQEIQDKVREEIIRISKRNPDGEITYDDLADMKYSEMCIYETLRKYSPAAEVPRQCTKNYTIPNTNIVLEKGTFVMIPAWIIHNDPEYYPDPEKFNPENFSPENKHSRHEFAFIPFGGGPRLCIGFRFALIQIKVNLIKQIRNYRFTLNPKTPEKCTFEPSSLTLAAKDKLLLDVTAINN